MIRNRLMLVNVDRGVAGPALVQRGHQSAGCDQLGARGIDDQCGRLHAVEIVGADDPACVTREPHVQG